MKHRLGAVLLSVALLAGCDAPAERVAAKPGEAPLDASRATDAESMGAGTLPPGSFQLSRARVISQSGENTALVLVTRPNPFPDTTIEIRRAAEAWCGRPARVTRTAVDRSLLSIRSTYLVRCGTA